MSTAADLYASAAALGRTADDCRETADDLERRAAPLQGLLGPVAELHTADTWSSMAADNSRRTLAWGHSYALDAIRRAIAGTVTALRTMAAAYESDERLIRRLADDTAAQERADARAAAEALPPAPSPSRPVPSGGGGGGGIHNFF